MPATPNKRPPTLAVCELFRSIAGETTHAGRPALFVRFSGCNLHCRWCDTPQARGEGKRIEVAELLHRLSATADRLLVLTGGEPLLQPGLVDFCRGLLDAGKEILLETNGSLDIGVLPAEVKTILDMKAPSSGESESMRFENLLRLKAGDELKLVVADRQDFDWARRLLERWPLENAVHVLFSPVWGRLLPAELARWMLEGVPGNARLQLQLHKYIWPDGGDGVPLEKI